MKKEYAFTFDDGDTKFLVTREDGTYIVWIKDKENGQCLLYLSQEKYKKMVNNFSEIFTK